VISDEIFIIDFLKRDYEIDENDEKDEMILRVSSFSLISSIS